MVRGGEAAGSWGEAQAVRWWDPWRGQSGGGARAKAPILARLDLWAGRGWTAEREAKREGQTQMGTVRTAGCRGSTSSLE